jgi:osmotically-inducible protein OsmY
MKFFSLVTAIAAAALLLGCGSADPEVDLERASEAAEETRSDAEVAAEKVKQREAELKQAQAKLDEARASLRKVEEELAKREAKVDSSATDEVLFRAVQKRLLDEDDLASVAIAAHVNNGLVVLTGNVPDAKLRDRAVVVAKETPGVHRIDNQIQLVMPKPEAAKKPAKKQPKK